jgi:ribosomal protein L31
MLRLKLKKRKQLVILTEGSSIYMDLTVPFKKKIDLELDPNNHFVWNPLLVNKINTRLGHAEKFINKFKQK